MMQNDPTMTCFCSAFAGVPTAQVCICCRVCNHMDVPNYLDFLKWKTPRKTSKQWCHWCPQTAVNFVCKNGSKCFTPQNIRPSYEDHRDRSRSWKTLLVGCFPGQPKRSSTVLSLSCGNIHWWMLHPIRNCGLVNENVCAHTTMKSSIYTCFVVETESCQTNLHKNKRPQHPSRNEISSESKCWKVVFPKVGFPVKKTGPNSTFHHAVRAWLSDPTQNAAEMNHEAKSKPKWLVEAVKMTMFPPNWFVFICMHREKCPVLWFGRVVVSPFGKNWIPKMFAKLRE